MIESFDISLFFGSFCRAVGMLFFLPLSMSLLSFLFRMGFALLLAIIGVFWGVESYGAPLIYEVLIGIALAFPFLLGHQLVSGWGELLDTQRGQSFGFFYDTNQGEQSLPTANLLGWFFYAVAAASGALSLLVYNYLSSFQLVKVGSITLFELSGAIYPVIIATLTQTFVFFLPIAGLFILVDFLFGVVSRFSPGALVQNEAFLLKSVLGLSVVYLVFGQSDFLPWIQALAVMPLDAIFPAHFLENS